ncbi:DNA polymerase Y family protein [Pseudomonas sp. MYb185]|uniref:Y-family DNA polymerase n=1 Tax=Pseudomonas sp. MYb185 TaxID=1848729 RepID=UPI000CFC8EA8|nr:DNA polymerase Y family protein [Pseudomonas sp. MYb185]PRB84153.1 DNA repair nucleotidyltransferase [Pseudomonas sp. MYb185]
MRWACILLTQLALDGVLRGRVDQAQPLVLAAGPAQRRVIKAANPAAWQLGLKPGLSLIAAQAVASGFAVAEYQEQQIEHWQRFLAAWAYRFSSHVSLDYPRALLVEVESSLGLFGPWPRFEQRLRSELTELGFRHRIVVAPNAAAARALAGVHDGLMVDERSLRHHIERLPISRCGLAADSAAALARMGLRQVRQLLALPRDTLARRFPAEVLLHLDRLLGVQPQALDCYLPADEFEARIEFNFEVDSHQALLFPLRRLLSDLNAFLAGRDCGVQQFMLSLQHRKLEDTRLPIGLLAPERNTQLLFEVTRSRLEQLQLPGPVLALRLQARDLPAFVPQPQPLFAERPQQSQPWEQLRERLRARLGDQAVYGLVAVADHRPECSWRVDRQGGGERPPSGQPRPGWLLPEPQPLNDLLPEVLTGPERIESGWWDAGDLRRDYYLVRTRDGRLAWVWQAVDGSGPFMLQGWFA